MSAAAGRLRAELSHACVRGLGQVAAALAGGDFAGLCRTFATWQAEARRPWPWLPGLCWKALEALDVTFPASDADAVVAGRLLIGTESDPGRAAAAVDRLRGRPAPTDDDAEPTRADADPGAAMRRRRLASAVDAFWVAYVTAARELSAPARAGDRAAADAVVIATRRRLEEVADRIQRLAAEVAGALAGSEQHAEPLAPVVAPRRADTGGFATPPRPAPRPGAAWSAAPPVPARPAPRARRAAGGDVEYVRVREHRYAPVVFVVAASLAAIAWLAIIASSGG